MPLAGIFLQHSYCIQVEGVSLTFCEPQESFVSATETIFDM